MARISDAFNRSDSSTLGSAWSEDTGAWEIVGNAVRQTTTGATLRKLRWVGALAPATNDVAVQGSFTVSSSTAVAVGPAVRMASGSTISLYVVVVGIGGIGLYRFDSGTPTLLQQYVDASIVAGSVVTLRLEAQGSALRGYLNGTLRVSATDSTYTSGGVGIGWQDAQSSGTYAAADDFLAYDLPAFVAADTNGSSTAGADLALSLPSGAQAGDLLIAALTWEIQNPSITPPEGWTLLYGSTPAGTARTHYQAAYWRVMQSGDAGPWTWSTSTGYERGGVMAAFRYVQTPSASAASTTNSSSASATAPTVTTAGINALVVHVASNMYGTTWTAPTNYTERADYRTSTGSGNLSISLHSRIWPVAGATGTITATAANADYYVAGQIVMEAALLSLGATGAPVQGAHTATGAATVSTGGITGAGAMTQGAQTATGAAVVAIRGTGSLAQGSHAGTGTARASIVGTGAAIAQGSQAVTGVARVAIRGAAALVQDAQTADSLAQAAIRGVASLAQGSHTADSAARVTAVAVAAIAQDAQIATGTARVAVLGAAAIAQGWQTLDASGVVGTLPMTGTGSLVQDAHTADSAARVAVVGVASLAQGAQGVTCLARVAVTSAGDVSQGSQTLAATAVVGVVPITGAASLAQDAQTVSGVAHVAIVGSGSVAQADDLLAATGRVAIAGATSLAQDAQTVIGMARVAVTGAASLIQGSHTLDAFAITYALVVAVVTMRVDGAGGGGRVGSSTARGQVQSADGVNRGDGSRGFGSLGEE